MTSGRSTIPSVTSPVASLYRDIEHMLYLADERLQEVTPDPALTMGYCAASIRSVTTTDTVTTIPTSEGIDWMLIKSDKYST